MKLEAGKEYRLRNGYQAVVVEEMPVAHMMGKRFLGRYKDFNENWTATSWYNDGSSIHGASDFDIVAEGSLIPTLDHVGKRFRFDLDICGGGRHHLSDMVGMVVAPAFGGIHWTGKEERIGWIKVDDPDAPGRIYAFVPKDRIILEEK